MSSTEPAPGGSPVPLDLTSHQGPSLNRQILNLAIPALGALIAEPAFLLADSAIVGRLGPVPLAGLGVAAGILASALWPFVFLAYATTATVSRGLGSGTLPAALRSGVDGVWLGLGFGAGLAVLLGLIGPILIGWFGATPPVAAQAVTYLLFSLPGVPAMLAVYATTGVLRGLQDTRTPLIVASTGALFNIAANLVLVHGLHLGIAGSAIGTALTQTAMAVWLIAVVARAARSHGTRLRPRWAGLAGVWRDGVPLLVRTIALRGVLLLSTWVAGQLGTTQLAAHQVALTIWVSLSLIVDCLAIAAQALTGSFLGAHQVAQARAATTRVVVWGMGYSVLVAVIVLIWRTPIAGLFATDPKVVQALASALAVVALAQPVAAIAFVLDGVLIGAGDGTYLARSALGQAVLFIATAAAALTWGPHGTPGLVLMWCALAFVHTGSRAVMLSWRARGDSWAVTGAAA